MGRPVDLCGKAREHACLGKSVHCRYGFLLGSQTSSPDASPSYLLGQGVLQVLHSQKFCLEPQYCRHLIPAPQLIFAPAQPQIRLVFCPYSLLPYSVLLL